MLNATIIVVDPLESPLSNFTLIADVSQSMTQKLWNRRPISNTYKLACSILIGEVSSVHSVLVTHLVEDVVQEGRALNLNVVRVEILVKFLPVTKWFRNGGCYAWQLVSEIVCLALDLNGDVRPSNDGRGRIGGRSKLVFAIVGGEYSRMIRRDVVVEALGHCFLHRLDYVGGIGMKVVGQITSYHRASIVGSFFCCSAFCVRHFERGIDRVFHWAIL